MNAVSIPRDLKPSFAKALACELVLLSREGRISPRLKPVLEEVYTKIARRDSLKSITASLDQLLQSAEGNVE